MKVSRHGMFKGIGAACLAVAFVVGLSVPAYSQSQTSSSGRRSFSSLSSRTRGSLSKLGEKDNTGDGTSGTSKLSDRLRNIREKTGEAQKSVTGPASGAAAAPPGARPGRAGGPAVVAPGAAKAAGAAGAAGARVGGAGARPGAAGLPGIPVPGAGGGGAGVRVVGTPTYEPVQMRELKYGKVPDIAEPPEMTLSGPMPVGDFLDTLSQATEWNVLVTEPARAVTLNFWISGVTPSEALEVLQFHDIWYEYDKETKYISVMTKQEYLERKYGNTKEQEFVVEHANVEYIESVVTSLMSPAGRVMVDSRTRHIVVWDSQDNLERMAAAVKDLDVPLAEGEFQVEHANVVDIEAIITSYSSAGGTVITDPRTGRIVVKDLEDNIERMRTAVARFDVPLTPRTYTIRHMNADALVDSVEALLTPERGTMQMDPRTNTIIVTDLPSRQERIGEIIATLDRQLETRTWVMEYVEPEAVAERIENLVPVEMGNIIVDEEVHQLTVTAIPERIEEIEQMVRMWDVKRQQVLIEAYLVTLSNNLANSFSINWNYFDSINGSPVAYRVGSGATPDYKELADTLTFGQLPYAQPLRNRYTGDPIEDINEEEIIKRFRGNKVAATLNYLDTNGKATILSAPRVTVQDGAEAMFQSGRNVPYVTSTSYDYGSSRNTDTTNPNQYSYGYRPYNRIEFIEVGTILTVLPRISEDKSILLEISAEDSDATPTLVVSNGEENTIPEKTVSLAETQVRVADGQTIVIGGLRRGNSSESLSRAVPLLSDVPILGRLFRTPEKKIKNDTLMIFLTTTIVSEGTHPEAETLAKADDVFNEKLRKADKNTFGRLWESVTRGKDEIGVSIGQSGDMHSGGKRVTMDDLRRLFFDAKSPASRRLVIRAHPRAPEKVVTEVTELALEAELRVEFDDKIAPFVPDYSESGEPQETGAVGMTPVPEPRGGEVRLPGRASESLVVKPK